LSRKIKLIWDFRGSAANEIARHHELHLKTFMEAEGLPELTGHTDLSELHSIAFLVVEENEMPRVRDALLPHRGEIFTD
jgi:hypothetical protein